MTFRPAQFPSDRSSRLQRDARGRWVLPPSSVAGGLNPLARPARRSRRGTTSPLGPAEILEDACSIVVADAEYDLATAFGVGSSPMRASTLRLVSQLHPDAGRAARFDELSRSTSSPPPEWVGRFGEAHLPEVVELPEPERRHLAIGIEVPDGPTVTMVVAVAPGGRTLDYARLWNGPPEWVMRSRCCPTHGGTLRPVPLNSVARLLRRAVTAPIPPDGWNPGNATENLWPLIWFVIQRLHQQD